jgi:hypothetical protein
MFPHTINDYYRSATESAKGEIEETADERVLGMEREDWIDYLVRKWGMTEIVLDESKTELVEAEREYKLRGYDIYTDQGPGTTVRASAVRIEIATTPTDTIQVIWKHRLAPNTFSISHGYPPFEYHPDGRFSYVVDPDQASVTRGLEFIKSNIQAYNESIRSQQGTFRAEIERLVDGKRARVRQKHRGLDDLAAAVGIPLRKKADAATVVPTAPRVRATIAPVLPPPSKPPTRPVLAPDKFAAILELIDNSGRQFERTPQSFQQLTEEGLRDIILGSLNAVFEGSAGGETFQGIGKVDIHLRISQGEVFLAEVKFWSGPESLKEVIEQLRGRLTWRDAYGVAIVLSRNAGFSDVLAAVRAAIPTCAGFVAGSAQKGADNHTQARFSIPSDDARQATIHVLVYNLYTAAPGRRTVKRAK